MMLKQAVSREMSFKLNRRSMGSMLVFSIATRLFCAGAVDGTYMVNSSWLACFIAFLLNLPTAIMLGLIMKQDPAKEPSELLDLAIGQVARRAFCFVLFILLMCEVASSVQYTTLSAEYVAFEGIKLIILHTVSLVTAVAACLMGGLAISGAIQLWRGLFYLTITGIILIQFTYLSPLWLTPILGPGLYELMHGALSFAGIQTTIIAGWLLMTGESGQSQSGGRSYKTKGPFYALKLLASVSFISCGYLALSEMLLQPMLTMPNTRMFAFDTFLSNGLNQTSFQLPLMLVWFMALISMTAFHMFVSSGLLHEAIPKIKPFICILITGGLSGILLILKLGTREIIDLFNIFRYPISVLPIIAFGIISIVKQRRAKHEAG